MHPLTGKQQAMLNLLTDYRRGNGGLAPTIRELQQIAGYRSPRSVSQLLEALQKKGYVRRRRGARTLEVLRETHSQPSRLLVIEVLGTVAAGTPLFAEENKLGKIEVSAALLPRGCMYFGLRVCGDSMDAAGIFDGDVVIVQHEGHARPGKIVVATIGDSSTVKRLRRKGRDLRLEPESTNPTHQTIAVTEDTNVQGTVVAVFSGTPPVLRMV